MLGRLANLGNRPRTVRLAAIEPAGRRWAPARGIAVVYASGAIELGESGNDLWSGATLGARTLSRQIEQAFRRHLMPARRDIRCIIEPWTEDQWAVGAASLVLATPFDAVAGGEQGELVRARLQAATVEPS